MIPLKFQEFLHPEKKSNKNSYLGVKIINRIVLFGMPELSAGSRQSWKSGFSRRLLGFAVGLLTSNAIYAQPAPVIDAVQAQRRAQEQDRARREQLETSPDVRLLAAPEPDQARLPVSEVPCFVVKTLALNVRREGPPRASTAPSGGSEVHAVTSLGAQRFREGPPQASTAPSGGSEVHAVASLGAGTGTGEGETAERFAWLLKTISGPAADDSPLERCLGAQGINLLLKRAQDALLARGLVTTRILAEPQDLKSGTLALTVLPGRVRAIRLAAGGAAHANPWNAVPIQPGDVLNLRDVEQALENFKRVPTAEADIQIEPGDLPGQSDLVVSYKQAFPLRLSLSADDSGSKSTGKYQGGITLSVDNPLALNDLLYLSFSGDLGGGLPGERGTSGRTLHYSIPHGYWLLGTTVSHNRYRQSVAGLNQTYLYRGTSSHAEVKLSRLVYRDAVRKTSVALGVFRRTSSNFIDDTEIEVQRRVVGGWQAALNHREFIGQSTLDTTLAYKRGTGAFGALAAPEDAFGEGTSRFKLVTLDVNLNVPFQVAEQRLRYNGGARIQANRSPLTPQDRFAIGGRYSVRGFDGESSLSAERDWLLRNDLGVLLGQSGHELYAGIDHGEVGGPSSKFLAGQRLTGAVLGLRGSVKVMSYDVFVGRPLKKPASFVTASTTVGVNLNYSF